MDPLISLIGFVLAVYWWTVATVFIHELGHAIAGKLLGFEPIRVDVGHGKRRWQARLFGLVWSFGWLPLDGFTFVRKFPATGLAWRGSLFALAGLAANAVQLFLLLYLASLDLGYYEHQLVVVFILLTVFTIMTNILPRTVATTVGPMPNDGKIFLNYLSGKMAIDVAAMSDARDFAVRRYDSSYDGAGSGGGADAPEEIRRLEKLVEAAIIAQDWPMAVADSLTLVESGYLQDAEKAKILDAIACIPVYYGAREWLEQAEEWAREASRIMPEAKTLRGTLGSILTEKGRLGEAFELLAPLTGEENDAIDRAISSAFLAKIYSSLDRPEKADESIEAARQLMKSGGHLTAGLQGILDRIEAEISTSRWRGKLWD